MLVNLEIYCSLFGFYYESRYIIAATDHICHIWSVALFKEGRIVNYKFWREVCLARNSEPSFPTVDLAIYY